MADPAPLTAASEASSVLAGRLGVGSAAVADPAPPAPPTAAASDVEEFVDSEDDDATPTVQVGSERIAISDVTDDVIGRMTADEKEAYILAYQDYYSHIHE